MAGVAYDIETIGRAAGSIIVSIGAVRFDKRGIIRPDYENMTTDEIMRIKHQTEFYREISVASTGALGLQIENETLAWWMDQNDVVRATLKRALTGEDTHDIRQVLADFRAWLDTGDGMQDGIWSWHGFDHSLTKAAYARMGVINPWDYKLEFDAATLAHACPAVPEPISTGHKHNALDDARWCARYVVSLQQYMGKAQQGIALLSGMELQNEMVRLAGAGGVDSAVDRSVPAVVPRDQYGFEIAQSVQADATGEEDRVEQGE